MMMSLPLFCYGTLRSPLVMKAVARRPFTGIEATLQDYGMFRMRDAEYPGILPRKGLAVEGILYHDIDEGTLRALDDFEGALYFRDIVEVIMKDGAKSRAFVYCVCEHERARLSEEVWDFDRFLKFELEGFMNRCFS